jgi:hypothetical protein
MTTKTRTKAKSRIFESVRYATNLIPQYDKPRKLILQAAADCAAMITVCAALKYAIVGLGGTAPQAR